MSLLAEHVDRLEAWLRRNPDAPTWKGVLIVEARHVEYGPIDKIPRAALCTLDSYEPRFEALFAAGYSWINLSGLGVHGDHLLVCVELPRDTAGVPYGRTSINLSGPPLDVTTGARVWDASTRTQLIE